MEKEFNPNDYQGRTEEQVKRNNISFAISTGLIALLGIILTFYFLFSEFFKI